MVALQERKQLLSDTIYDEKGNLGKKFTEEDLDALLQPIEEF